MLYGATGYTGRWIARQAQRDGLAPVLAGRASEALARLARDTALPSVAVGLDQPDALAAALADVAVVLHCAGPFAATSAPMRAACLAAGTHYLDITGEIEVFTAAHAEDQRARDAGVLLCPGVGFDVVPTDCIAACLHQALPDATHLALGFSGVDTLSAGTAATSLRAIARGATQVRRDGVIMDAPFGSYARVADFGGGRMQRTLAIPWGDVATAHYSTGIPNIEVHIPARSRSALTIRALLPLRSLLRPPAVQGFAHRLLRRVAPGPSAQRCQREAAFVWGEASNAAGQLKRAELRSVNGYELTVRTALMAVKHVLANGVNGADAAGYRTPTQLMGPRCVEGVMRGARISIR